MFWKSELRATYAFVERNRNLVKRYWGWELVWLTYSIVNSLAITFIGFGIVERFAKRTGRLKRSG